MAVAVFRLEDIEAWLKAEHGFTDYFHYGDIDRVPKSRHNFYNLMETGGFGLATERALDQPTFQAITQGSNGDNALAAAYRLDAALIDAEVPLWMGGMFVADTGRVGGPPAFLARDDDEHVLYACNYRLTVGRMAMT